MKKTTKEGLTIRMDKKEWDNVININLTSTFSVFLKICN